VTARPKQYSSLSQSEVALRLAALPVAERMKLVLAAKGLARNTGWSAEELLQEAMTRMLAGTRSLPAEVSVVAALYNAMKSVASGVRKSSEGRIAGGSYDIDGAADEQSVVRGITSTGSVDPESAAIASADAEALYRQFAEDEHAQLVMLSLAQGMTREEICVDLKIDSTRYATIRRRLRRAFNAL
jgi:DNA-directed RNA polymerase specialized sigma24 family protein